MAADNSRRATLNFAATAATTTNFAATAAAAAGAAAAAAAAAADLEAADTDAEAQRVGHERCVEDQRRLSLAVASGKRVSLRRHGILTVQKFPRGRMASHDSQSSPPAETPHTRLQGCQHRVADNARE